MFFSVTYIRSKVRAGKSSNTDAFCYIKGDVEMLAIRYWMACFSLDERTDEFFSTKRQYYFFEI